MIDSKFLDLNLYNKQDKIGEGSYGKVYKVCEKFSDDIYAAKISKEKLKNEDISQIVKIKREINIMVQLNHPSILKFIGYSPINFKLKSRPVIITEYCSNGSLKDILKLERESKSLNIWNGTKKLINIFGIASAMSYLHAHNIIHRDLKPANILENEYLFPKIADFGLSKNYHQNVSSMTGNSTRGAIGTPIYIPPEVITNYAYSKSGDVYAFSLIVYEIMTLDEPYPQIPIIRLYYDVCYRNFRPEFKTPIPECYKKLIQRCWSADPKKRPTFDEIIHELKTNKEFITDDVNEEEYLNYIDLTENANCSFDPSKKFTKITISKPIYKNELKDFEKHYDKSMENTESKKRKELTKDISSSFLSLFGSLFEINEFKDIEIRQYSEFEIKPAIIGKGSFGVVREAVDKVNGQKVAYKDLCLIVNEEERNQISREIEIMAKINHYSIQHIYGYVEEDLEELKSSALLTVFEDNKNLEEFIQNKSAELDFTQKYIIMYGIASGINHLHNNKIIHGKLNPKSVLINDKMEPKITNFYQSKKAKNNRIYQELLINESIYIAPELIKMENDSYVSLYNAKLFDVYNFSLLVYYIFTGERPWNNIKQTILLPSKIIEGERPNIPIDFPKFLSLLIQACWDKNPNNRPSFSIILDIISDEIFLSNLDQDIDKERLKEYQNKVLQNESTNYQTDVCINDVSFPKIPKNKYHSMLDFNVISYENEKYLFFDVRKVKPNNQPDILYDIINIKDEYSNDIDVLKLYSSLIQILIILNDHPVINKFYGCCNSPSKFISNKIEYNSIYNYFPMYKNLPEIIESSTKYGNLLTNIHNLSITNKFIILYGIASGMSYLHDNNIYQLNLNPENILLNENFEPIIKIDITSKSHNKELDLFTILSEFSYQFVAPELFYEENDVVDLEMCDVYSFAMICYFLFAKKKPWDKNLDNQTILMKAMNGERPLIKEIISFPFNELIENCWDKDPSKRPSFNDILDKIGSPIFVKSIQNINFKQFQKYQKLINMKPTSIPPFKIHTREEYVIQKVLTKSLYSNVLLVKEKLNDKLFVYEEITNSNCQFIERASLFTKINFQSIIKPCGLIKPDDDNQNAIIILPYASKGNLESLIENKFLNYTHKCIILYGIAIGMLKLHDQGFTHKNLNPQNILINKDFEPWISGFILPNFNMLNDEYSTDVYSFGMITYYLFTDINPYQNDFDFEKMKFPKNIEQPIINLISECLKSSPKNRPSFKQICDIISDYKFYLNPNYSFDVKKFYDYQIKLGELSFVKFSLEEIEKMKKNDTKYKRKVVCFKNEQLHQLYNSFDVLNYFQNFINNSKSKSYLISSEISEDLFKNNSFLSDDFNTIVEKYDKVLIEVNFPSESFVSFIHLILELIEKNQNKFEIKIVISDVLYILCLPKIQLPLFSLVIRSPVIAIGPNAFRDCKSLKKIKMPNSVTKIGRCAFQGCSSLIKVKIPSSIVKIGKNAFKDCSSLNKISIPSIIETNYGANHYGIDDKTEIVVYNKV